MNLHANTGIPGNSPRPKFFPFLVMAMVVLMSFSMSGLVHAQELLWATQAGGLGNEEGSGDVDSAGNSYVAGEFEGSATFGGGEPNETILNSLGFRDIFLAKYDSNGSVAWATQAGGVNEDGAGGTILDPLGNLFSGGEFEGLVTFGDGGNQKMLNSGGGPEGWLGKFDPANGVPLWVKRLGPIELGKPGFDNAGNMYFPGTFEGAVTVCPDDPNATPLISSGGIDMFIGKLNPNGELVWVKHVGVTGDIETRMTADSLGNVFAFGHFTASATFGQGEANEAMLTSDGERDLFLAKFDPNGDLLWVRQEGGVNDENTDGIILDGAGNILGIGGFGNGVGPGATLTLGEGTPTILTSAGFGDIFIAKYDTNGNLLWAKGAGGDGFDDVEGIDVDALGNAYLVGDFGGTFGSFITFELGQPNATTLNSGGFLHLYIAKFDINGNLVWAKKSGALGNGGSADIALDGSGNIFATGFFSGTSIFGSREVNQTTLDSAGGTDFFLAKLSTTSPLQTLTVIKTGSGTGTVTSEDGLFNCGVHCSRGYQENHQVKLIPVADSGSIFAGFSGHSDCADGMFDMDADKTCFAIFDLDQSVTFPNVLGIFAGDVAVSITNCQNPADNGAFSLTGTTNITSQVGSEFSGTFELENLALNLQQTGVSVGQVSETGDVSGTYETKVFIGGVLVNTAQGTFTGSLGNGELNTSFLDEPIQGNTCVTKGDSTGLFISPVFTLTITKAGSGTGTVSSDPLGIECGETCSAGVQTNQQIQLSTFQDPGSVFAGFTGDPGCETGTVIVDTNKNCIANFRDIDSSVVYQNSGGTGSFNFDEFSNSEMGNQITLEGVERFLSEFSFNYRGEFTDHGLDGDEFVRVRFYENDGPGGTPGPQFYESDLIPIISPMGTTEPQEFSSSVSVPLLGLLAPDTFTWAIEGLGVGILGDLIRLPAGGTPSVGMSEDLIWSNSINFGWVHLDLGVPLPFGFKLDATIEATSNPVQLFPEIFQLTVNLTGPGSGTVTRIGNGLSCPGDCTAQVEYGIPATVVATPEPGSFLIGWTGCAPKPLNPLECTLTLMQDEMVTAEFGLVLPDQVAFVVSSLSIAEDGGQIPIVITRTGFPGGAISIDVTTSDVTATQGSDYTAVSETVFWDANDFSPKTVVVPIQNDTDQEGNETFLVNLSNPIGGVILGAIPNLAVNIVDTDTPPSASPLAGEWYVQVFGDNRAFDFPQWAQGMREYNEFGTIVSSLLTNSDGIVFPTAVGNLAINPDRTVTGWRTLPNGTTFVFDGMLDTHQSLIAGVVTGTNNSRSLSTFVKKGVTFAQSDLEGTYHIQSLGDARTVQSPIGVNGHLTIDDVGNVNGQAFNTEGGMPIFNGNLALDSEGSVTGSLTNTNGPTFDSFGAMDAQKSIMARLLVSPQNSRRAFNVLVKKGSGFTTANLEGTWQLYLLRDLREVNSPLWAKITLTLDVAGTVVNGQLQTSEGLSLAVTSGSFAFNAEQELVGSLTYETGVTIESKGSMDVNKTFAATVGTGLIGTNNTRNIVLWMKKAQPFSFDIDGNGKTDALTDGMIILRYLFGFKGQGLVNGVLALDATRTTPEAILEYLDSIRAIALDVDGNGKVDAFTDGMLIARFLMNFTGDSLIDRVLDPSGTRTSATAIQGFLSEFIPDTTPPTITITNPLSGGQVNNSVISVTGFVDESSSSVQVNGISAEVRNKFFTAAVPLIEGPNTITAQATDAAGNSSSASVDVTLDTVAPVVAITAPVDGALFNQTTITVNGTINDPSAQVVVNGVTATVAGGTFTANISLQEGTNDIVAIARDLAQNQDQSNIKVRRLTPPVVNITEPKNLVVVNGESITVKGAVDDPLAKVSVNGVQASNTNGAFTVDGVSIREGTNVLTAVATNQNGTAGTVSIQVIKDTQPPTVTVKSPINGLVTSDSTVTVTGMIHDIVVGTVNPQQATVMVNGIEAQVANRSFFVADLPLTQGQANTITAIGMDRAGNTAQTSIIVNQQEVTQQPTITLVSGNNQTAEIGTQVSEPLIIQLRDENDVPMSDQTVIFKVVENNGLLTAGERVASSQALQTDVGGNAQVFWTLGTRAGAGNNRVETTAVGFAGLVTFSASAQTGPSTRINVDIELNYVGIVNQPLPNPFTVVVSDDDSNSVTNVPVTFSVVQGGGHFNGQAMVTVNTDADGRALAVLCLGPDEGIENNKVETTFSGNSGLPVTFVASGKPSGDASQTTVTGVVLDNTNLPLQGVTITIRDTALVTQTDAQGQFVLAQIPVGHIHLRADGRTAQRDGTWPVLEFELNTIAGQTNTLGMPIFLLPIDVANGIAVNETTGGTITLPNVPGFALTVAPGSATFPDGGKSGTISVTLVNSDKLPMPPNKGLQPRMPITVQPPGVHFDPPAPVTFPNVDELQPGEVTELFSFDHDQGRFVGIGTATVSPDGSVIMSDPGIGIVKSGWDYPEDGGGGNGGGGNGGGGNGGGGGSAQNNRVSVTPTEVSIFVGESIELTASGTPPGTPSYSWTASNSNIAEITSATTNSNVTIIGKAPGTTSIGVSYSGTPGTVRDEETVSVNVLLPDIKVTSVTFKSLGLLRITADNGQPYGAPHWKDANEDGDVNDAGDNNFPVAFEKDNMLQVSATFKLNSSVIADDVKVRGTVMLDDGKGEMTFEDTLNINGDFFFILERPSSRKLPNEIRRFSPLEIKWEVSFDGGNMYWSAGPTQHKLYITLGPPLVNVLYETLLDVGTRNANRLGGQNSDLQQIADSIFSDFTDHEVLNAKGEPLLYWGLFSKQNPKICQTLQALLLRKDGSCVAWADFFVNILKALRIDGATRVEVDAKNSPDDIDLLVKKWDFTDPPSFPSRQDGFAYAILEDAVPGMSIRGQGPNDDPNRFFGAHYIVCYKGKFFDPSYGIRVVDEKNWQKQALSGLHKDISGILPNGDPFRGLAKEIKPNDDLAIKFVPSGC